MTITPALSEVLLEAINLCYKNVPSEKQLEEHGGWIVTKGEEFKFFPLRNDNSGTPKANVLFTANRQDIGKGPAVAIVKEGWRNYGTFHTHPQFSVRPSFIDYSMLFKTSKYNFIYSQATNQLGVSCFKGRNEDDTGDLWEHHVFDVIDQKFIPATFVKVRNTNA